MPVSVVTNQVVCELREFLREDERKGNSRSVLLNPRDELKITLTLQTDVMGNVGYTGVDLKQLGLNSLADLVAFSTKDNAPSLGAKGQLKNTVSAAVEVKVTQHSSQLNENEICLDLLGRTVRTLFLKEWLKDFFNRMRDDDREQLAGVRMSAVTLKTDFQILAELNAGVNPLFASAVILPIKGINAQLQPALTHKLEMQFTLCDRDRCTRKVEWDLASYPRKRPRIPATRR